MSQRTLITWQEFFSSWSPANLEAVIDTALRQLNHVEDPWVASLADDLKDMLVSSHVRGKSPRRVLRDFLISNLKQLPDLMYGPVVIWGEAEADIIAQVQRAAEQQGLHFGSVHQHLRSNGIECLSGSLDQLTTIANNCAQRVQRRQYAFPMAAFWLCGALLAADETADPVARPRPDGEIDSQPAEELSEAALADRAGRELIDWQTIMSALPPAYHATLLDTALQCAAEIRADETFSDEAFKNAALELDPRRVVVDGYPNGKAPYKLARRTLLAALSRNTEIPFYVVALWAFTSNNLIVDMAQVAKDRGLHFGKLTERFLSEGLYRLPDQVPVLAAIATDCSQQAVGMRVYDYQLAAHWLSAAQLTDAEWAAQQTTAQPLTARSNEESSQPDMTDLNVSDPTSVTLAPADDISTANSQSMEPAAPNRTTDSAEPPAESSDTLDANGRILMPWSVIIDAMDDDERNLVVEDVFRHSHAICRNQAEANAALKEFALLFDRRLIDVDGYSPGLAPYEALRRQMVLNMTARPYLNYFLFSLWADANHDALVELAEAAEAQGWHFGTVGRRVELNGVHLRNERISDFHDIINDLILQATDRRRAHAYILGSFWLLGAELSDEEWAAYSPPSDVPQTRRFGVNASAADWLKAAQTSSDDSTAPPTDASEPHDEAMTPANDVGLPADDVETSPDDVGTPADDVGTPPNDVGTPANIVAATEVAVEAPSSAIELPDDPPDANGRSLMSWDVITQVMPPEYMETVVDIALQHSRAVRSGDVTWATPPLLEFADMLDRRKIAVKGYPPGQAPYKVVRRHWLTLITDYPELNLAVIGLWASAYYQVVTELMRAAEAQGYHFGKIGQRIGPDGIYGWPEQITQLGEVAIQLGHQCSAEKALHYKLATFWLMAAQLNDEEWAARQAATAEPATVELAATEQALEPGATPTSEAEPISVDSPVDEPPPGAAPSDRDAVPIGPPADLNESPSKPIGERTLITWPAFFNSLPPVYLETVIDTVLRYVNHVHDEPYIQLAATLKRIISEKVQPDPAPRASVRNFLLKSADEIPESLYIMLLLWSDAAHNVVAQVERAARARGLHFDTTLAYFETAGIYCLPQALETLTDIADECVRRSGASIYPFRLAAFLLCAAQLTGDEWAARADLASEAVDRGSVEATDNVTSEAAAPPDRPNEPIESLVIPGRTLMPWADVLHAISREDRRVLIDVALLHSQAIRGGDISAANDTLKEFADALDWQHLAIDGYRPGQAPLKAARHYLQTLMTEQPDFTGAVMGLWADAKTDILIELQFAAADQGWHFGLVTQQFGLDGLYLRPDQLPRLTEIAEHVSRRHPAEQAAHFRLAAIWLCALQLTDEEWTAQQAAQSAAPAEPSPTDTPATTDAQASAQPINTPFDRTAPRRLRDWSEFFRQMPDDYRETLVDIALRQTNRVLVEPYISAAGVFKNLGLKGFRAGKVPHQVALQHYLRLVNDSPVVAQAVINLWGDASRTIIVDFRKAAEARGFRFIDEWPGQLFVAGYYNDEPIQPLVELAHELGKGLPILKQHQMFLAAYWFSAALLLDEPSSVTVEPAPALIATEGAVPTETPISEAPPAAETPPADKPERNILPHEVRGLIEANLVPTDDLPTVRQQLRADLWSLDKMRQGILPDLRSIITAVEASNLPYAEERFDAAHSRLAAWRIAFEELYKDIQLALTLVSEASSQRPGFDKLDVAPDLPQETSEYAHTKAIATDLISRIDAILDYDRAREAADKELVKRRTQWTELQSHLAVWHADEVVSVPAEIDAKIASLIELEDAVTQFNAAFTQLNELLLRLRTDRETRLAALIQQLNEADLDADTIITDSHTLDELISTRLADLSDETLIALEAEVAARRESLLAQAKQNEVPALAARWRETHADALLLKLLSRLVRDQREVEAALLIFSTHAAQPAAGVRWLSAPIVRGVLTGLLQLAPASQPFAVLRGLTLELHTGRLPADGRAQAAWYLGLLGAHYGSSQRLSAEVWWQLPAPDWPFDDMPRWRAIWQAARTGQSLPAILPSDTVRKHSAARAERLAKARGQIEQLFIRENGWLPRLRTIRSKRHIKAFTQHFSPLLVKHLMVVRQTEVELEKCTRGDRSVPLARLERDHHEFSDGTTDEQLEGEYERLVEYEKFDDSDPVQRRATIKVWQDCVYALIEYGEALIAYWRGELARTTDLNQEQLEAELAPHIDLVPLGQAVVGQLIKPVPTEEYPETQVRSLAERHIVSHLLSQADVAARLPRTLGQLARTDIDWAALSEPLLLDLSEPLNAEDAARLWLDRAAPDHVLLLAAHVPIELQKRAQSLRTDLERSVIELQAEVIKLGGEVDDLIEARTLGRWAYARDRLQQRLAHLRTTAEIERQRRAQQALALRHQINDVDEAIFQIRDTLPVDVYDVVEQGLALARRAAKSPALIDVAQTFLQEIDYRYKHQAWPVAMQLQAAVDQLERALSGEQTVQKATLTAEEVLKLLERENLAVLGAFAHQLSSSEMGTRADLLRNWQRVRGLPSFLSDELAQADRQAIQAVFRYFARMMSMKRVHSIGTGAPLEFDDPTVYAYYELRYPKTDALRDQCVMVSLPGNPPRASEVAQLQDLMDEKGWLDDAFVLVFAPGCTPALAKRLTTRRLVILDDAAMLEWVLAERKYSNPLSRLRPRLLNAIGAANVEVFKINQLVNSRTGIFVGRERDVERVASSDANFAIYGGRRIGKSSFLKSIDDYLRDHKVRTAWLSVEGQADLSDNASAARLARQVLGPDNPVKAIDDLKPALQLFMDNQPDLNLVIFIDEIDKYIVHNPDRHVLIEALRSLSNLYPGRFRTIVAGFTDLYDCLKGRGPYTPTSDPWRRMFNDLGGPLGNLLPENAEKIVSEGFAEILGWDFEKRAVPQLIVERTGSHPAFIQKFCLDLQRRVAQRGDGLVRLEDIDAVFGNDHPEHSFIAYVRDTLKDNLDPIGRYLSVWLARESHHQRGFTWNEAREITSLLRVDVNDDQLDRSLERLKVTSVVRERAARVYEFSVPDYPLILSRLGETLISLDQLEREIVELVEGAHGNRR